MERKKNKIVEQLIRGIYSSLESHLIYTHTLSNADKKSGDTHSWHQRCVKEYAELIRLASELY